MKAEGLTPLQILQQAQRLMVPLFQRPYVWGREAHWQVSTSGQLLYDVRDEYLARFNLNLAEDVDDLELERD